MNYYMTIGNRFMEPLARATYLEIGMIEEQHVTHYETILDPTVSWFENLVFHEYTECWLYYSFMQEEPDPRVKALYELHLNMEIEHLRIACELMRSVEKRDPEAILPATMGPSMSFRENRKWVRSILEEQVDLTAKDSEFVPVADLPDDDRYFAYQRAVNGRWSPTEEAIRANAEKQGREYRLEVEGPNPVEGLRPEGERNNASTDYARRSVVEHDPKAAPWTDAS